MINEIRREGDPPVPIGSTFTDPTEAELGALAKRYRLLPAQIADCLQPMRLPKREQLGDLTCLIVRAFEPKTDAADNSVEGLTCSVAVFLGNRFSITARTSDERFIQPILNKHVDAPGTIYLLNVMLEVLLAAVETYQAPLEAAENQVHAFEAAILTDQRDAAHWTAVFHRDRLRRPISARLWASVRRLGPVGRSST